MFICTSCGAIFSTPEFTKNNKTVCPECGAKSIREANYCRTCHDYFIGDYCDHYCPDCIEAATEQLRKTISKWIDPDYIELLRSEYNDIDYIMEGEDG